MGAISAWETYSSSVQIKHAYYHGTTINTSVSTDWDAFNFLFLPSHHSPCFVWLYMGSHWPLTLASADDWDGLLLSKAFPVYFLVTGLRTCRHMCEPVFYLCWGLSSLVIEQWLAWWDICAASSPVMVMGWSFTYVNVLRLFWSLTPKRQKKKKAINEVGSRADDFLFYRIAEHKIFLV